MCIGLCLSTTVLAVQFVTALPQNVAGMSWMWLVVQLVNALALDKGLKCCIVGAFVDTGATMRASEIPFGFFQGMHAFCLLGGLFCQEAGNDLCSYELLWNWPVWAVFLWVVLFECQLGTGLSKPFFYGRGCEGLVDPFAASSALEAASMGLPTMKRCLPGFATMLDQLFLVLLCLSLLMSWGFLVDVVLLVGVNLCR